MNRIAWIICVTVILYAALHIAVDLGLWGLFAWTLLVLSGAVLFAGVRK